MIMEKRDSRLDLALKARLKRIDNSESCTIPRIEEENKDQDTTQDQVTEKSHVHGQ